MRLLDAATLQSPRPHLFGVTTTLASAPVARLFR
jgi:hypothetical protein